MAHLIKFYTCAKGKRTRWHCPMPIWEGVFGFSRADLMAGLFGFAIISGAPMRMLITKDVGNGTRGRFTVRDRDSNIHAGGPIVPSHGESTPGARIDQAKDSGDTKALPIDWEGTFKIVAHWESGVVIELDYSDPSFRKPPAQNILGGL